MTPADSKQAIPSPEDRVRAIREREQKATKGPWHRGDVKGFTDDCVYREDGANICKALLPESQAQNLGFIAHARADIPYLLSLVEELKGEVIELANKANLRAQIIEEMDSARETAEAEAEKAKRALREIAQHNPDCDCTHEDENCCAKEGVFCPKCIAAAALTPEPASQAAEEKK